MPEMKTSDLENILLNANAKDIPEILKEYHQKDFPVYMREHFDEHGYTQQQVFIRADISLVYGYKLLSGEKHTTQRDTIIRICYAAGFSLEETQRALKLYGMSPLYAKIPRDALIMKGISDKIGNILDLNEYLITNKEKPLRIAGRE